MSGHTPTPWRAVHGQRIEIRGDDGRTGIAVLPYGTGSPTDDLRLESEANAALIVQVVNHFEELKKTVQGTIDRWHKDSRNMGRFAPDWLIDAQALLRKVGIAEVTRGQKARR